METIGKEIGGGLYNASYRVVGESNAIAAMPSIHFAITFLLIFPAWHAGKRWFIAACLYAGMMGFSLIYLGEHYFVDVVAGGILRAILGRLPGALVTGGAIGFLAWLLSGAMLIAIVAGVIALLFTLLGSGMGAYVGGRSIGGGRFGDGSNRDIFRGGGGGFGGGGASGRW